MQCDWSGLKEMSLKGDQAFQTKRDTYGCHVKGSGRDRRDTQERHERRFVVIADVMLRLGTRSIRRKKPVQRRMEDARKGANRRRREHDFGWRRNRHTLGFTEAESDEAWRRGGLKWS